MTTPREIKLTSVSANKFKLAKVRKVPQFKFAIAKKPAIHTGTVQLKGGGKVTIEANRNLSDYVKIAPVANSDKKEESGGWTCQVVKWNAEVINRDTAILNPQFTKIYAGAIYDFASIANGQYKTLPYARKPMTIVSDNVHFKKASTVIQTPSAAAVMTGIIDLKKGAKPGGVRTVGNTFEMLSEEDFFMRTGGSGYYLGFGGSHDFNFKDNKKSHKYVVEVYQAYYTIFVDDSVNEPKDFFHLKSEGNKPDAIEENKIDPNWVYVDSVTYGRMLYVVYESDYSLSEFGMDISMYANVGFAGGEASLTEKQKKMMQQTKVTIGAVGGNAIFTALLSNSSSFKDLQKRIDDYFKQSSDEALISYSLRTIDQSTVGTKMITNYTSRQCAPRASKYRITWDKVVNTVNDDPGDSSELAAFARIRAIGGNGKNIKALANLNAPLYQWDALPDALRTLTPAPWTFTVGNKNSPLELKENGVWKVDKRIEFEIPMDDANAKLAIRTDVVEYDSTSADDQFDEAVWERKISELADSTPVSLVCRHDASRITFWLTVEPVYEG